MTKCEHQRAKSTCSICRPEQVFNAYKYKALNQRHIAFTLTLEQFEEIVQQHCRFCGEYQEPRGIDRRDNRIGYVFSNCQSCCTECNRMKNTMDQHRFLSRAARITKHQEALRRQKSETRTRSLDEKESPAAVEPNMPGLVSDPTLSPEARRFLNGI